MKLPFSFAPLFHNYIFETIDMEKHCKFIIKTVLARGTWEQIMWLFEFYGAKKVQEVFLEDYCTLQELPESTRKLWELVFVKEPLQEENYPTAKWRIRRLVGSGGFEPPTPCL